MYRSIYYVVGNLPHDKKIDTSNKTHPVYDEIIIEKRINLGEGIHIYST